MATALQIHDDQTPARRRVVGLVRVSTISQYADSRGGPPRQRAVIEATIKNKNLDCLRVYELADVSGTDVIRNPTVIEILQLVSSGVVTGLVVADLDRLFRPSEPTDYAILQVFKDTGAIIYSGDTEYNLQSKDSALFANIRSAISGFELQLMRERQEGAKEARRRAGKCATPLHTLPLGISYNHKTERWSFNEKVATVVELFRLVDEEGICNYCELERRTGTKSRTAYYLLRNPIYTGWRVISEKRGGKKISKAGKTYRVKIARKPEDVIRTKVLDAVVSQEQFDRVQALLADIHANHRAAWQQNQAFNFLTGIGFCAYCGERIYGASGKSRSRPRHGYYVCKRNYYLFKKKMGGCKQQNLKQQATDDMVEQFAVKILTDPATLQQIIEQHMRRTSSVISPFPVDAGGAQSAALKRKLTRLLEAYENGVLELDEYRTRRDALRHQLDEIERRVAKQDEKPITGIEEIARKVVRGAFRLKRVSDVAARHEIIHSLLAELHVKDDAIVAFRLRLVDTGGSPAAGLIFLQPPFSLRKPEPSVPAGFRRCSCCGETKPEGAFYTSKPRKNECRLCLSKKAHAAYLRRRAAKFSRAGGEPDA